MGEAGQGRRTREQTRVGEIQRMEVDEEQRVRWSVGYRGASRRPDLAPEVVEAAEPFGRVEDRARMRQSLVLAAQEGFVSKERSIGDANDGLVREPQRRQDALEARLEAHPIRHAEAALTHERKGFSLHAGHAVEANRAHDHLLQLGHVDRLRQVLKRPERDRLHGRIQTRIARHQDDRYVQIALADRLQELDPVHAGHVDVAHHGIERRVREELRRPPSIARRRHFVPFSGQHPCNRSNERFLVVDQEDAASCLERSEKWAR
jgi:hypothetical protein